MSTVDISTATAVVGAILAFFTPMVVAVISRPHLTSLEKQAIALAVSVVLAAIALAVTGGYKGAWYTVVLSMIGISQAAYTLFWKTTGAAPKVEAKVLNPVVVDGTVAEQPYPDGDPRNPSTD